MHNNHPPRGRAGRFFALSVSRPSRSVGSPHITTGWIVVASHKILLPVDRRRFARAAGSRRLAASSGRERTKRARPAAFGFFVPCRARGPVGRLLARRGTQEWSGGPPPFLRVLPACCHESVCPKQRHQRPTVRKNEKASVGFACTPHAPLSLSFL